MARTTCRGRGTTADESGLVFSSGWAKPEVARCRARTKFLRQNVEGKQLRRHWASPELCRWRAARLRRLLRQEAIHRPRDLCTGIPRRGGSLGRQLVDV